jgi:hypothetical protein
MSLEIEEPVHWRGRRWAVTAYGIEALDGTYHVPAGDIWPEGAEPPAWARDLRRRYGIDCEDLDAALKVARSVFGTSGHQP